MRYNETLKHVGLKIKMTEFNSTFEKEHGQLWKELSNADFQEMQRQYGAILKRMRKFDAVLADKVIKRLKP